MRPVRPIAVILALSIVGIPGSAKPPATAGQGLHPKADKHFAVGEYRRAAASYRVVIERYSNDLFAVFGLARSVAATDDCREPLVLLEGLRSSLVWNADMAVLEAACRATVGDLAGADAAFEETIDLGGDPRRVLPRLAETRLVAGDLDGFEAAVQALEWEDDAEAVIAVLRAREGVQYALPDADERIADAWRLVGDHPRGDLDVALTELEAHLWLQADEPVIARSVLMRMRGLARSDPTYMAWSVEALRRAGDHGSALAGSERVGIRGARGAVIDAVRARIFVDVGRPDDAAALLDDYIGVDHPEVLASRWYLALAQGDEAGARRWAKRWAAESSGVGSLDLLVPTWRR